MERQTEDLPTDEEMVRRFRQGDQGAFDLLVLRYRKEIYRMAYRITGNHAEADDLAQETFCRAWQAIHEFRGDSTLRTWLYRIVSNLSLNVVQSARVTRRAAEPIETMEQMGGGALHQQPELDALVRHERREQVHRAVKRLPRRQRLTLILRAFEGLQYKEIAKVMGCTTGTAKANFFHAVACLKRQIKELP